MFKYKNFLFKKVVKNYAQTVLDAAIEKNNANNSEATTKTADEMTETVKDMTEAVVVNKDATENVIVTTEAGFMLIPEDLPPGEVYEIVVEVVEEPDEDDDDRG